MEFKPPMNIALRDCNSLSVFLAGTIDMGNSYDWQKAATTRFLRHNITVFNPRRDEWDSSWEQSFEAPQFSQQVNWELDALEKANLILLHFDKDSLSPISLLELGLYAASDKLIVNCPKGFYRKGNVDIVCNRFNVPLFEGETPSEAIEYALGILINNQ
jgi:hypothetical protein